MTQELYWFGLPDLRPVLNHPGREFHYNSGFKSGSPETLQPQVLRAHLQPYNKFYTGSLVTYLTISPSHQARVWSLHLKAFLTKFSYRTNDVTHLSSINALLTRRDLTTMSTE